MKQFTVLSLMAALTVGACVTGTAVAQEDTMLPSRGLHA
jgi:hypothetical protein